MDDGRAKTLFDMELDDGGGDETRYGRGPFIACEKLEREKISSQASGARRRIME